MQDRVLFHILTAHTCGGDKAQCQCAPDHSFPARVLALHQEDGVVVGATLDIEFPMGELERHIDIVVNGRTVMVAVWRGFISYQDFSPPAVTDPPESGTWTPLEASS
jgi:hypothetical protein